MEKTGSALQLLQYDYSDDEAETSIEERSGDLPKDERDIAEDRLVPSSAKAEDGTSPDRRFSEDSFGRETGGLISDEEVDHHVVNNTHRKRPFENYELDDSERPSVEPFRLMDVSKKMAPAVSPNEDNSSSSLPDSQHSGSKSRKKTKLALVSYGTEQESQSEEESSEEESELEEVDEEQATTTAASISLPKVIQQDSDDIQLPPEPPGKCTKDLQDKIADLYARAVKGGFDPNEQMQRLTSFRNPSIYEKLIQLYKIDEFGSNFDLTKFDPHCWGKSSYYDELDKAQRKDMEKREKDRKTKIEFISGTKKSNSATAVDASYADDKKRKSKWDALPPGLPLNAQRNTSTGANAAANLTMNATGTRATVISAVGTLTKKNTFSIINTTVK